MTIKAISINPTRPDYEVTFCLPKDAPIAGIWDVARWHMLQYWGVRDVTAWTKL